MFRGMMLGLNERLDLELDKFEVKYNCNLSIEERERLVEGISIGGTPSNTYDRAVLELETRLLAELEAEPEAI